VTTPQAVSEFLSGKRIAVIGVSRSSDQPANLIYRTLRSRGYEVFAVNPAAADTVEGDPCYRDVDALPKPIDGAVIVTPASAAAEVVKACAKAGIPRVWLHRSFGEGSVSDEAARVGREHGVQVLVGGCPMMYSEPVDFGHRCMRWVLGFGGRLPS
jgi:predicted CoA-binding protein